jgi:hypothetical protein
MRARLDGAKRASSRKWHISPISHLRGVYMGIDVHALNFIRYAEKQQPLGSAATIGRQGPHISKAKLRSIFPSERNYGPYCEELLIDLLGATKVESFDNSDYEQATHIADMNLPIECAETYDTVLDAGTLEHIYNSAQALKNVSTMCAEGGQILHILPANNQCGHGFWQFTPELFHSLYSQANGYSETTVFLASFDNEAHWYEVEAPSNGQRIIIQSVGPLYVLCGTKRGSRVSHDRVQQSDYVYAWDRKDIIQPIDLNLFKKLLKGSHLAALNSLFGSVSVSRNPFLTKRSVGDVIAKASGENIARPRIGQA